MRLVIQRVRTASVKANDHFESIQTGLLVLVGIEKGDGQADLDYCAQKLLGLRIFNDPDGKFNLSIRDIGGELLVVSQFTLLGDGRKGNRPSFTQSEEPAKAREAFDRFVAQIRQTFEGKVATGVFGAHMDIELVNDGPVTILIDSRKLF
jgi:D-tyrosyl-tRNA(Tyr) deacylase